METAAGLFSTIPFSKLTVKQICEAANINRNTFYRNTKRLYISI
ncbi:TetR/AcrR family transcriptional regulator [Fructobacillus cardui]